MFVSHGYFYNHQTREPSWRSDCWNFSLTTHRWTPVPASLPRPNARYKHTIVAHEGSIYLFGGDDGGHRVSRSHVWGSFHRDLWRYAGGRWGRVHKKEPLTPRQGHSAAVVGGRMLVFGGLQATQPSITDSRYLREGNELWSYDFAESRWESITPTVGRPPPPRRAHSATVLQGRMYVFGGFSKARGRPNLNDLWAFDPATRQWHALGPRNGTWPPARGAHIAVADQRQRYLYVFGGADCSAGCTCMDDLWRYSVLEMEWTELKVKGPTNRHFHTGVMTSADVLYIFGGESYRPYKYFNDVWNINLSVI
eukprot:EG_transcript_20463